MRKNDGVRVSRTPIAPMVEMIVVVGRGTDYCLPRACDRSISGTAIGCVVDSNRDCIRNMFLQKTQVTSPSTTIIV